MVQKTEIKLFDDLNGMPGDETVAFSLDGVEYNIDLTTENADKLREALDIYIQHGTRIGGKKTGARKTPAANGTPVDNNVVREWAKENGIEVAEKGRLPKAVIEQWRQST